MAALAGLFGTTPDYLDGSQRWVGAERWAEAFRAYEAFLDTAPGAVLDPPPPELAVLGVVLQQVVEAGIAATLQ